MSWKQRIFVAPVLLPALCCIQSCGTGKMFREIDQNREEVGVDYATAATQHRKSKSFTWKEAVARQETEDPSIRRSRQYLEEVCRQRETQWRGWLPRPTLYVSFQNAFKDLGNLTSEDLRGAFIAPITIPNPWAQTATAYQLALTEVQAEASNELTRRRQVMSVRRQLHLPPDDN